MANPTLMFDPWSGTSPSDDSPPHWHELSVHVRERIGGACINVLAQHSGAGDVPSPVYRVLEDVREDPAVAKAFRMPGIQPGAGLIGDALRRLLAAGDGDVLQSLVARRDALDVEITRLRNRRGDI